MMLISLSPFNFLFWGRGGAHVQFIQLYVLIYLCWCPMRFLYQMMFVLFNRNTKMPLVQQELLIRPVYISPSMVYCGFEMLILQFSVQYFVNHCLSFCHVYFFMLDIVQSAMRFMASFCTFLVFMLFEILNSIYFKIDLQYLTVSQHFRRLCLRICVFTTRLIKLMYSIVKMLKQYLRPYCSCLYTELRLAYFRSSLLSTIQ